MAEIGLEEECWRYRLARRVPDIGSRRLDPPEQVERLLGPVTGGRHRFLGR